MGVIFSPGYTPYVQETGSLLMETGEFLLLESGDQILLDLKVGDDYPINNARIAHSRNWGTPAFTFPSSTEVGYFAEAPNNTLTYERWKPAAMPADWRVTFSSTIAMDYCCIAAHTMGTNGNTLAIQYWNGSVWVDLITPTAITDDSDIFVIFPEMTQEEVRILISDGTAPEIGVVKFGSALQLERPLYGGHSPILFARRTVLKTNESETGEYLGVSKYRTYLESTFSWQNLSASWIRSKWDILQRAIETEPFFIAWRPGSYDEVAFGRATSVPIPTNMGRRDLMSVELAMRARSYD